MPSNTSGKAVALERETRIWSLRQKGWSQRRIAEELEIDQGTVCRALDRINKRELKRLSERVEAHKIESTHILEHIRDEAIQAWEKSKRNKRRVLSKGTGDGKAALTEVVEREGDPAHLDRAITADREIRRIWGADAPPPKAKEDDGSGMSVSAIAQRLKGNAEKYESNASERGPGDRGGSGEVPEEPGSVQ